MDNYSTGAQVDANGVIKRLDEAFGGMETMEEDDRDVVVDRLCRWLEVGKYGQPGRDVILALVKYIDVQAAGCDAERFIHAQ